MKLKNYILRVNTNVYKDQSPDEYIITPYIYIHYYSCEYYYEKTYTIGLCWLYWSFSLHIHIDK
jgi:hypothetical protein